MTTTDSIWAAAEHLLRRDAEELRESSTLASAPDDWTGEEEAKEDYDEHIAVADALASLSTVAAALPPSYFGGSLVTNAATGECVVRMHFGNAQEAERWFDAATDSREAAPKAARNTALDDSRALEDLGAAIVDAMDECPVADVLSVLTGALVGLAVELMRRQGYDTTKAITLAGGEQRDVTISAQKEQNHAE